MKEISPQKREKYLRLADKIRTILETSLDCQIPDSVYTCWQTTLVAIHIVDHMLDNTQSHSERKTLSNNLLDFVSGADNSHLENPILRNSVITLRNSLEPFSSRQKLIFVRGLQFLSEITEQIKHTENISEFLKLRQLEGQLTSQLFLTLLPDKFKHSERYQKIHKAFRSLGRLGNLTDSLLDLKNDFATGQTAIQPSLENRIRIALTTLKGSPKVTPIAMNLKFWRMIIHSVLAVNEEANS
jgi:hypothetical protein